MPVYRVNTFSDVDLERIPVEENVANLSNRKMTYWRDGANDHLLVWGANVSPAKWSYSGCLIQSTCSAARSSAGKIFSMEILQTGSSGGNPKVLMAAEDSSGNFELKRFSTTHASGVVSTTQLSEPVSFYPALNASQGIVKAHLVSLRSPYQNTRNFKEALLYILDGAGAYLYRTRDEGVNWYRVAELVENEEFFDVQAVRYYDPRAASELSQWYSGFSLVYRNTDGPNPYKLLRQNTMHGF